MKYLFFFVAMVLMIASMPAIAANALSPWLSLSSNAYLLPSTGNSSIFIMASVDSRTKTIGINLMNIGGDTSLCVINGVNQTTDLGEIAPYKINNQYVRMRSACFNGTEVDQPVTEAGRNYLLKLVQDDKKISVEINSHVQLIYLPSNFQTIKNYLTESNSAM